MNINVIVWWEYSCPAVLFTERCWAVCQSFTMAASRGGSKGAPIPELWSSPGCNITFLLTEQLWEPSEKGGTHRSLPRVSSGGVMPWCTLTRRRRWRVKWPFPQQESNAMMKIQCSSAPPQPYFSVLKTMRNCHSKRWYLQYAKHKHHVRWWEIPSENQRSVQKSSIKKKCKCPTNLRYWHKSQKVLSFIASASETF